MPLVLLGLIVIIGIVIYALVQYANSEERDTRPVRERYAHVFESIYEKMKKGANYTIIDEEDENEAGSSASKSSDGHTMYFPSDAEVEKRKRNIH